MTRRSLFSLVFALCLVVTGCGQKASQPNAENGPTSRVQLQLFATTNCINCQHELPQLQQQLHDALGAKFQDVDATVYLVLGDNGQDITQARADQFGRDYGLKDFKMVADDFGTTYYQKYFSPDSLLVPAAVILKENGSTGSVDKIYQPGQVDVNDIVARVQALLK